MKICSRCGAQVKSGDRVCANCGNKLRSELGNATKALLAVMFFALGLCCVALYSLHVKQVQQDEQERLETIQSRLDAQTGVVSGVLSDEGEEDEVPEAPSESSEDNGVSMVHTDLSGYVGTLPDQLIAATGAIEMETEGELSEYHTENDAIIIKETEDGYTVQISSENIYSLYDIYVGMGYEEAVSLMESKEYAADGTSAFKISDVISLEIEETDSVVSGLILTYTDEETE